MRTWMRSKVRLLFMTCAVLLAIPAIALADNAISDGDGPVPLADSNMAFGDVGCNVPADKTALIAISRQGSATGTNTFGNGEKVTVTVQSVTGTGLSAVMNASPAEITLPSNWTSSVNGTLSANVSSKVTINSSTPGPGSGSVTYVATGKNTDGNTISRPDTMNVSWTTGSCDTTAPSVTSISTANTNPTNTTGNVSWNVTFSENVTGVDAADFNLANTGLGGSPAITNVSGSGASYTVTASSGTGSGTLGLNLSDNDSIKDAANNPLGGTNPGNGDFTGAVYVIDRAAPTMTGSAVLGPDFTDPYTANSWTNQSVRVTFTCADTGGSGITSGSGNDVQNFTAETDADGVEATSGGTCADNAGNSATAATFGPIRIDKTNPTINGSASPAPNGAGWNNTNVTVSFTCTDALSDVASCPANVVLSSNGADQSASGTATDNAGNSASTTVGNIDIDKTAPTVEVTGVSNGANYTTGAVPTAGCSTTDQAGLSGVKTNASVNVTGGNNGFGTFTATCTGAEDNADNPQAAPVSVTYTVSAAFNGFLQPIDGHSVNTGKFGRTYPIKWQLRDSSGALISDSAAQALVATMSGGQKATTCDNFNLLDTDALEESTTGNTSLRYDATSDQFIYNYKAPTSGSCYIFAIRNADGVTTQQIDFKFTK